MLQLAKKASEAYQITVKNADGQVMWDSGDLGAVRKTYIAVTQSGYQATATLYQQGWNGRLPGADGSYNTGDWAPEGEYTFTVRGRAVGSDVDSYLSYNFYVDNTRPEVKSAELFEDENGDLKLALTVSDDKYLQFAWVVDSAQQYYYLEAADEFKDAEEGATVRLVLDASDLVQQLSLNAANPGRVGILVSDCANNTTVFVDIGPQGVEIEPADIAVGETKQLSYKVYPASMQDIDLTWTSSDESAATVNEKGEVTGVSDGTVRITATSFSRLSSYCMVTVGQGVATQRNFSEAPRLGEIFTTADGLWWKVTSPDTVQLQPENNKTQNYAGSYASMAEVVAPATVEYEGGTYRVTSLASEAFCFNMKTTSVTLPEGLETIGGTAFFFASGIKTLRIPDSVKTIGAMAFSGASGAPLNIPKSVQFIGDSAFASSGVVDGDPPEGVTVTITDGVTIGGKLCIEGKLIVPRGAKLNITENAVIIGQENIVYEGCTHEHSKEVIVEATCTRDGSKSIVCQNCGETLSTEVIPAAGHHYEDGKCTDCGAEDSNYQPGQPEKPENPGVKTDDESSTTLWVLVMASAAMLTAAVVALPRRKHSR